MAKTFGSSTKKLETGQTYLSIRTCTAVIASSRLNCPYCGSKLVESRVPSKDKATEIFCKLKGESTAWIIDLSSNLCTTCGFWFAECTKGRGSFNAVHRYAAAAVKRVFPIDIPEPPMSELVEYLRRHPERMREIHPTAFEKLVAECFRANWKPVEVVHVGKTNDGGIDLILVKGEGTKWLVQCKRRSKTQSTESVSTVREMLGTLLAEGNLRGIVVSSADHFSYEAQKLKGNKNLSEKGSKIDLIDYGVLREMLIGGTFGPKIDTDLQTTTEEFVLDGPWSSIFAR